MGMYDVYVCRIEITHLLCKGKYYSVAGLPYVWMDWKSAVQWEIPLLSKSVFSGLSVLYPLFVATLFGIYGMANYYIKCVFNSQINATFGYVIQLTQSKTWICHPSNPKFHWLRQIVTTFRDFHWQFWINFLDAIAKAKKLICKSIAQNLKWVSLFLAFAMAFNLLLSNLT